MKAQPIHLYVGAIVALGLAAMSLVDWGQLSDLNAQSWWGFGTLIALALASEAFALPFRVGSGASKSSLIFIPLLASILIFGPAATLLCFIFVGVVGEFVVRRKQVIRALFNVAQWALGASVAGLLYSVTGGEPMALRLQTGQEVDFLAQLGPFLAFGICVLLLNHAAVSGAIALSQDIPFRRVWIKAIGRAGTNLFYDLLVMPVAMVVASAYIGLGPTGFLISVLPLLFIRHAYATNLRLVEANRDLLKALVKAIETRDPYTSGHSVRVSALARRIAQHMGVSERRVRHVEAAALLHDIGKIDASYTEILKKPSALSDEERRVIESHVHKGVELLRSLASFPREVVDAVKSHHERPDGKGYPEGLAGDAIPLGARIIKVCDAVDAMLSDRPYRPALELDDVRDELQRYSGSQFDPHVTMVVTSTGILEEHARELQIMRQTSGASRAPSWLEEEPSLDALFL